MSDLGSRVGEGGDADRAIIYFYSIAKSDMQRYNDNNLKFKRPDRDEYLEESQQGVEISD